MTATDSILLAAPNVSEGRDRAVIEAVAAAFASTGARLLDVHADADHNRSVFTLAARPGRLWPALVAGGAEAVRRVDMRGHDGVHPCVGALDVAPVVHLDERRRGAACAEALTAADELARALNAPVLLYGLLGGKRTRADLRRGGLAGLSERLGSGELKADFGVAQPHPAAGAVLVAARPPLVAFNVELTPPAGLDQAREIAAALRQEGGAGGLPGVRAIGLWLDSRERSQVSFNVEDPASSGITLARIVSATRERAAVETVELVGLAPLAALRDFPSDVESCGPDPRTRSIEDALD